MIIVLIRLDRITLPHYIQIPIQYCFYLYNFQQLITLLIISIKDLSRKIFPFI